MSWPQHDGFRGAERLDGTQLARRVRDARSAPGSRAGRGARGTRLRDALRRPARRAARPRRTTPPATFRRRHARAGLQPAERASATVPSHASSACASTTRPPNDTPRALPERPDHARRGRLVVRARASVSTATQTDYARQVPRPASSYPPTRRRQQARAQSRGVEDRHALHLGRRDRRAPWSPPYGYQAHGGYDCSRLRPGASSSSTGDPAGRSDRWPHRRCRWRARSRSSRAPAPGRDRGPATCCSSAARASGSGSPRSNITHVGIALGNGFMINSSGQGVTVAPLWEGWRVKGFSFARRVL